MTFLRETNSQLFGVLHELVIRVLYLRQRGRHNNIGQQIRQQDDLPTLRSVMLQCISAEHNYTFICRSAAFIVEINHDLRLGRKVGKIFIEMIQSGGSAILQAKLTLDHFQDFGGG